MNTDSLSPEDVIADDRTIGNLGRPIRVYAGPEQESNLLAPAVRCPLRIYDNRVVGE